MSNGSGNDHRIRLRRVPAVDEEFYGDAVDWVHLANHLENFPVGEVDESYFDFVREMANRVGAREERSEISFSVNSVCTRVADEDEVIQPRSAAELSAEGERRAHGEVRAREERPEEVHPVQNLPGRRDDESGPSRLPKGRGRRDFDRCCF